MMSDPNEWAIIKAVFSRNIKLASYLRRFRTCLVRLLHCSGSGSGSGAAPNDAGCRSASSVEWVRRSRFLVRQAHLCIDRSTVYMETQKRWPICASTVRFYQRNGPTMAAPPRASRSTSKQFLWSAKKKQFLWCLLFISCQYIIHILHCQLLVNPVDPSKKFPLDQWHCSCHLQWMNQVGKQPPHVDPSKNCEIIITFYL